MGNKWSQSSQSNSNQSLSNSFPQQQQQQQQDFEENSNRKLIQKKEEDEIVEYNVKQLEESKKVQYNLQDSLSMEVRGKYKCLKTNSKETQLFPVMLSLKTKQVQIKENAKDQIEVQRAPIDLVCVIDHSGSMSGDKIKLVRETLKLLLDYLTDQDRLSLVQFDDKADVLANLTRVTKNNVSNLFPKIIGQLKNEGGTDIAKGMGLAFQILKERKYKNPITSIFLLSDGQDGQAQKRVSNQIEQFQIKETFTIHTFGFGKDHDPVLMNDIAKLKNGNFYYIEKIDKVDEFFIDALAGLVSVVAQNIVIKVTPTFKVPFSDCSITNYFGDDWENTDNGKQIKITNLISGVQKDFIMEIKIPPITNALGDMERNAVFLKVQLEAQNVELTQKIQKEAQLDITFYNQDEDVPNYEEDPDVMFNYLRVLAAQSMKDARLLAKKGQFDEANNLMENVMKEFDGAKKVDKNKLQILRTDVVQTQKLCKPNAFSSGGMTQMMQMESCWMNQKSKGQKEQSEDVDMYENNVQFAMKKQVMKKKGI